MFQMPREKPNTSPDNETVDRTKSRMAAIVARRKKMEEMDEFTREFLKELPKLPDDDELRSVLGSNLIRDPLNKVCSLLEILRWRFLLEACNGGLLFR